MLAAFLLLAPLYFLGPFAVLALLARPRAARELFALAAAGIGIALAVSGPAELGPGLVRASGVALSLGFALLNLRPKGTVLGRAALAVLITGTAIGLWCWLRGIVWSDVERAFTTMWLESYRVAATRKDLQDFIQPILDAAPDIARVTPGLLALQALAGIGLASGWHHRIAREPVGSPPARFRQFRFNDHLIWGAIFTLALLLLHLPREGTALAVNLLVLWGGLYATRGLAVFSAILALTPVLVRVLAAGLAVLLNPIALGGCLAVGLADTWLDIRRRLPPPAAEGVSR